MKSREAHKAIRHLRRAQELLNDGFGDAPRANSTCVHGFGQVEHLEASWKLRRDHCSLETVVQCLPNCWLVASMTLLIKLPGLYPHFPPEMKTWLEGVQESMRGDVPTCTSSGKPYSKLWIRFLELDDSEEEDVSDAVVHAGKASSMLRASLEQIQNATVAFNTLDFEARLRLDETTLGKIVEIADKNRGKNIQMITLDNYAYFFWHRRTPPAEKPPNDERFIIMEDIEGYILNIERRLRRNDLTLRGGTVSYNLSSERGKIGEINHGVSFTICDQDDPPDMVICSWGECQKNVDFMRPPGLGLILEINLIIYSVDEFYDASPEKHWKRKYYDAPE